MDAPVISFTVKEKKYEIDFSDIDGLETRAFRLAVGFSPPDAIAASAQGMLSEIEVIAGLMWMIDRRDNPKLTFDEVLGGLTYKDLTPIEREDDASPPDEGGRSESDSPPSSVSTESSPGNSTSTPMESLTSSSVN